MNKDIILKTGHLTKSFKNITAVEDLSMEVKRGDIFGFLGPNGAGKSTTIRMILGLIKPTQGEIRLFNKPLAKNRAELLGRIGALVEKSSLYEYLTARKNLEIFGALSGHKLNSKDIDRVLDIVSLLPRGGHKVKTYSQGMKQRLGVAQALLGNPELVILDEPTAGLDPKGIKEIRRLIIDLAEEGFTIFLSSHILHEVEQMCGNMAIINKGRLVVQGEVAQLLNSGRNIYKVKIDNPKKAVDLLIKKDWVDDIKPDEDSFTIKIEEEMIPVLTELLVQSGVRIYAIQPKKSLEDYFLSLLGADNV